MEKGTKNRGKVSLNLNTSVQNIKFVQKDKNYDSLYTNFNDEGGPTYGGLFASLPQIQKQLAGPK